MEADRTKFNETNVYRVRNNTRLAQGLFLCKVIMKKHGSVQIQGMGQSMPLVAKISQILSKDGYGVTRFIKSDTIERKNSNAINPKLIVKLDKSPQFDKMTESIQVRS